MLPESILRAGLFVLHQTNVARLKYRDYERQYGGVQKNLKNTLNELSNKNYMWTVNWTESV